MSDSDPAPSRPPRPTLRWAVWVLLAQTVVAAVGTTVLVAGELSGPVVSTGTAVAVSGYCLAVTLLFAAVTFGLARRRRWARGPGTVLELLMVPIGLQIAGGGRPELGFPLLLLGLVGAGLLFAPPTRAALDARQA